MTTAPTHLLHPVTVCRPDGTSVTYRAWGRASTAPGREGRVDRADCKRVVRELLATLKTN